MSSGSGGDIWILSWSAILAAALAVTAFLLLGLVLRLVVATARNHRGACGGTAVALLLTTLWRFSPLAAAATRSYMGRALLVLRLCSAVRS